MAKKNPFPGIGQTPALDSDKQRLAFRTEADSEGGRAGLPYKQSEERVRQLAEGRGKQEDTMRAVTVYRLDDSNDFSYHTRHPIGSVLELRTYERVNNYKDLLRLARRLFALDTADAVHVLIDVGQGRQAYLPAERDQ